LRIIDAHLHASGHETTGQVLEALDAAGIDGACIMAPFLHAPYTLQDAAALRAANDYVAALVRGHGDRLYGFAVANPLLPGAAAEVERCAVDLHLRGLKLVPAGWYPYDEPARRVYERAEALELPLLFHSGVFIDGRSSRFCRPAYLEALRDYPRLRAVVAHLGWPWTDEAIAVCLIDRIQGVEPCQCQFRLDISFGPPPAYRETAVGQAWQVLGPEMLVYGSDRFFPCPSQELRSAVNLAQGVLNTVGAGAAERQQVLAENALRWLRLA
jgi:uncharacterized protein